MCTTVYKVSYFIHSYMEVTWTCGRICILFLPTKEWKLREVKGCPKTIPWDLQSSAHTMVGCPYTWHLREELPTPCISRMNITCEGVCVRGGGEGETGRERSEVSVLLGRATLPPGTHRACCVWSPRGTQAAASSQPWSLPGSFRGGSGAAVE